MALGRRAFRPQLPDRRRIVQEGPAETLPPCEGPLAVIRNEAVFRGFRRLTDADIQAMSRDGIKALLAPLFGCRPDQIADSHAEDFRRLRAHLAEQRKLGKKATAAIDRQEGRGTPAVHAKAGSIGGRAYPEQLRLTLQNLLGLARLQFSGDRRDVERHCEARMTKQAHDGFQIDGGQRTISAFIGGGIFRPADFAMSPKGFITGCRRGFRCSFSVEDDSLLLRHLVTGQAEPRRLLGGWPVRDGGGYFLEYEDLPEPVPFTGGILIGTEAGGYETSPMDHRDIRSRLPFRLLDGLQELLFEGGKLLSCADRSAAVLRLAERIRAGQFDSPKDEIEAWLAIEFTARGYVDYERWLYGEA